MPPRMDPLRPFMDHLWTLMGHLWVPHWGPKLAPKVEPRFGDLGKKKTISLHGTPKVVANLADSQGNLYTLGLRTWIWNPLVLVHAIWPDVKPTSWPPISPKSQNKGCLRGSVSPFLIHRARAGIRSSFQR